MLLYLFWTQENVFKLMEDLLKLILPCNFVLAMLEVTTSKKCLILGLCNLNFLSFTS